MRWIGPLAVASLALTGCGPLGSLNPFGGRDTGPTAGDVDAGTAARLPTRPDPTVPLAEVTAAVIEPGLRGSILRAEGVAPAGGYHSARLALVRPPAPQGEEEAARPVALNGVLRYDLRAVPPELPVAAGTAARRLNAAVFVPAAVLEGVERIDVRAGGSVVSLRPPR